MTASQETDLSNFLSVAPPGKASPLLGHEPKRPLFLSVPELVISTALPAVVSNELIDRGHVLDE